HGEKNQWEAASGAMEYDFHTGFLVEGLATGFFIGRSLLGRTKLSWAVCLPVDAVASPKYDEAKYLADPRLNVYRLKAMGTPPGSEIERFDKKLRTHLPFAFSRFGEGELRILEGHSRQGREYTFLAGQPEYESLREQ